MKYLKTWIKSLAAGLMCLALLVQIICPVALAAEEGNPQIREEYGIYLVQKWLNQEYSRVPGFVPVPENGQADQKTMNGLTRALQHELRIKKLSDVFDKKTEKVYARQPLQREDGAKDRKYAILQGALVCKGYGTGHEFREMRNGRVAMDTSFDASVEEAVRALERDIGYTQPEGIVTPTMMKALLSTDSYQMQSYAGADPNIRAMQQDLNRRYGDYIGVIATDGIYGRGSNTALILALQAEEGMSVYQASGYFGDTTRLCCPEIPYVKDKNAARRYPGTEESSYYTSKQIKSMTILLQYGLYVNGYGDGTADGVFDEALRKDLQAFQKEFALPVTGKADKATWMSLLVTSGDSYRPAKAADCAAILNRAKAENLYKEGYRYIGRYLTGTMGGGISKAITQEEAQIIFDAGLNFFPIFQTAGYYNSYFNKDQGTSDAYDAIEAASALGIPAGTIIYFAVDYDSTNTQITNNIMPYFEAVHQVMQNSQYRTGIYGSRNTCTRVSDAGYAMSSFVADMSSGYSGNMSYRMPKNWAFDQFANIKIGSGETHMEIDKDGFSGRDEGVSYLGAAAPQLQVSNESSSGKPYLKWKAVNGAQRYEVYSREGKTGEFTRLFRTKGTHMTNTSAEPGKTYYYKVCAIVDGRRGTFSKTLYRTCDCAQPQVAIALNDDGKPILRWEAVDGAVKYEVYRATSANGKFTRLATVNGTKLTNTSAESGKTYYYKVRALSENKYGTSAWSQEVHIRCGGVPVLTAPKLNIGNEPVSGKVALTWNSINGADYYEIYRRIGDSGSYELLDTCQGTKLTDTTGKPGDTCHYQVRAVAGKEKGPFSTSKYRTVDCAQPQVTAVIREDGKPVLTWDKVDGAVKYEVYRALGSSEEFTRLTTVQGTKLVNSSAEIGQTYRYQVMAVCENEYGNSAWSETVSATCTEPIKLSAPTIHLENDAASGKPVLTWDRVEGAKQYQVYRRIGKSGSYTLLYTTHGTRMKNTSAHPGEDCYYKVRALTGVVKGPFSVAKHRTCDCAQPIVTGSVRADGKPVLTWKKVKGAVQYEVYRALGNSQDFSHLATVHGTKLTNTSAKSGQEYQYQVMAVCEKKSGNSARSETVRLLCGQEMDLSKPTVQLHTDAVSGKIYLTWDKVEGAGNYEIYRRVGKEGRFMLLDTRVGTKLTDHSAEPGVTYYYQVRAAAGSKKGPFSNVKYRTCDCAQPQVTAMIREDGKPVLVWEKVDGAVQYEVYRALGSNGEFSRLTTVRGTKLVNSSAKPGQTYRYQVMAVCENKYGNSAWSEPVHATCTEGIKLSAPATQLKNDAASGKPVLTWDRVEGAKQYQVYRRIGKSGDYTLLYTTSGTRMKNASANPGENCYYQVRALTGVVKGPFSIAKHITCDCAQPDVTITARADGKPVLRWEKIEGAIGYEVYRAPDSADEFSLLTSVTGTKLTNSSAESNHTYYYKVRAICANSHGNSADSEVVYWQVQ